MWREENEIRPKAPEKEKKKNKAHTECGEKKMGYIYILTNPDYTDIKVGYAKNVEQRLSTLNRSTSLRSPFELYATYEVDTELADKDLHVILDTLNPDLRKKDIVNGKTRVREFFSVSPEQMLDILRAIAKMHGREDKIEVFAQEPEKSSAGDKLPVFRFSLVGLKPGDKVEFIYGGEYEIASDRRVICDGEEISLSALAKKLEEERTGRTIKSMAGPRFFKYNGVILADMR